MCGECVSTKSWQFKYHQSYDHGTYYSNNTCTHTYTHIHTYIQTTNKTYRTNSYTTLPVTNTHNTHTLYIHTYIHTHTYTHTHINTHIQTTHTHTHIHTRRVADMSLLYSLCGDNIRTGAALRDCARCIWAFSLAKSSAILIAKYGLQSGRLSDEIMNCLQRVVFQTSYVCVCCVCVCM